MIYKILGSQRKSIKVYTFRKGYRMLKNVDVDNWLWSTFLSDLYLLQK